MTPGNSRAAENKRIRQDALREQLAAKGLAQQVVEAATKIAQLSTDNIPEDQRLTPDDINRLKIASELRLKLVNKYLPDLKSTELSGDPANPVTIAEAVTFNGSSTTN